MEITCATLSHELKTFLNGISGYLQLLGDTSLNKTQKGYMRNITDSCFQMVKLVNDMLDLTKIETGNMTVNADCFKFQQITDQLEIILEQKIKQKNIRLIFITDDSLLDYIISDKQKITQILLNLVDNAIKFNRKNGRILINITKKDENSALVSVEDNGIGIKKCEQKKVFEPFFRSCSNIEGSGLGLTIVKKFVELLQGRIDIESEEGQGTIFRFSFGCSFSLADQDIDEKKALLRGKHCLILDSDSTTRLNMIENVCFSGMIPIPISSEEEYEKLLIKSFSLEIAMVKHDFFTSEPFNPFPMIIYGEKKSGAKDFLEIPVSKKIFLQKIYTSIQPFITEKKDGSERKRKKHKILVVEDNRLNSKVLIEILEKHGCTNIKTASSYEEARTELSKEKFHIIFLDLILPDKNGLELLKDLETDFKGSISETKIAIVSASILETTKRKCIELGVSYFVNKPIKISHIISVINSVKIHQAS